MLAEMRKEVFVMIRSRGLRCLLLKLSLPMGFKLKNEIVLTFSCRCIVCTTSLFVHAGLQGPHSAREGLLCVCLPGQIGEDWSGGCHQNGEIIDIFISDAVKV